MRKIFDLEFCEIKERTKELNKNVEILCEQTIFRQSLMGLKESNIKFNLCF